MKNTKKQKAVQKIAGLIAVIAVIGFTACAGGAKPAEGADELDTAIREASDYLNTRIPKGNKVAFINISGGFPDLADYILSDLSKHGVNDGIFSVVDRAQLEAVRAELNFNMSGEVSDQSAQAIGQMLGAQTIVSGSIRRMGALYRLDVKAIEVQTASVQGQWNKNIPSGGTIAVLTVSQTTTPAPAPATAAPAQQNANTRQQPAAIVVEQRPAAPAPAALTPGTYTFYPRPRAMKSGMDIDLYLDKIVIRSGFMNIFLVDRPDGRSSGGWGGGNFHHSSIIQDLDRPARSYNASGHRTDDATRAVIITFENVTATRFSFRNIAYGETLVVFEEIILGNPD